MDATTTLTYIPVSDAPLLTFIVTIAIAVAGWVIALVLQWWNIRREHQVEVRYDIYKQLVSSRRLVQDAISKLSSRTGTPFILMDSHMIPFDLKLEKDFKGVYIPYTEFECVFKGEQEWAKFVQTSMDSYFDYVRKYLSFMSVIEDWSAAVKSLLPTQKILFEEVNRINNEILEDLKTLQGYPQKYGHDWRTWERPLADAIVQRVSDNSFTVGVYISDFMTLIHNQLLSGYFGYRKSLRKTLYSQHKVLTQKGFEVKLREDREEIIKDLQAKGVLPIG